jgi:acyl-CoA ligase (AMP-forming) (exosortase A-associated)
MFCFTFHDLLAKNLLERPGHTALESGDRSLTYSQLDERVEQLAGSLHALGLRRGDRVCIHLPKCMEEVISSFAVSRLGGVFVNLNILLAIRQLKHGVRDAGARFLFMDRRRAAALAEDGIPDCVERIIIRDAAAPSHEKMIPLGDLPQAGPAPQVRVIDGDLCAVLYTSGSTGLPKGVMLSHQNVVQSGMAAASHLGNRADDRVLCVLPLSFDFGLSQLTSTFLVGATLVLQSVQMPPEIARTLERKHITGMATVPTGWIPFTRFLEENGMEFPELRYVAVSGGMLPKGALRAWKRVFPNARKYVMYGMTEGFRSSYLPPEDFDRKLGSIGKPLPNVELFVVHPEKGLCGPGEHGELLHRGSLISMGYLNNPEATLEKIRPCPHLKHLIGDEAVLHSGDTVYQDEEGYLYFVARTTTFIKCSDFRISPTEVEDIFFDSGMVTDVVAFGVPDEIMGQAVHAALTPRPGRDFDQAALLTFCRKRMPNYMVPRGIHIWEGQMPRTPNGKLDRPAIIAAYTDAFAPLRGAERGESKSTITSRNQEETT